MSEVHQFNRKRHGLNLDLNLPPYPGASCSDSQSTENGSSESEVASRIRLEDLSQYFNLPIKETSKHLKVGLTVLKEKCREFGIPRWPHRKIKCLDGLIHTLEEEILNDDSKITLL